METVGQALGRNLRRLRDERRWTQEETARQVRRAGVDWTRDNIAQIETGRRRSIDLETLVPLADCFGIALADLFEGDGAVELDEGVSIDLDALRQALNGATVGSEDVPLALTGDAVDRALDGAVRVTPVELDVRTARRFELDVDQVTEAARGLWGRTMTEEREARVDERTEGELPARSLQAVRGHVSRELLDEIRPHLEGDER